MILLDTNILLRYVSPTDLAYATTTAAATKLHAAGETLAFVSQNVYEFWAAATCPLTANGLGFSTSECQNRLQSLRLLFAFLPDSPNLYVEWELLVLNYNCQGRASFDARLVAAMHTHGMNRLLTFNVSDFTRYSGIAILDPAVIAATSSASPAP